MHLKEKAIELAKIYQKNKKVQGVLLAGSVSRGWEDQHSDIELHVLWLEPPNDTERLYPIEVIKGQVIDFFPYEEEEWSETYITPDNIKMEISNFLVETIENRIQEVVFKNEIDYDKQCILASVQFGTTLYGESLLKRLKEEVEVYPSSLAETMIHHNLDLGNRWNNRKALLDRTDLLMLYEVICSVQKKIMGTLFALNKMYVHHPAFKWINHTIEMMEIKPKNLNNRLTKILTGDINDSISELELLIEEIQSLVKENYPNVNVQHYEQKANLVRPKNIF